MATIIYAVIITAIYLAGCLHPLVIPFYKDETRREIAGNVIFASVVASIFFGPAVIAIWYQIIMGL